MILLLFLFFLVTLIFFIKNSTSYWKQRNVIGPKPTPIFGNIKESVLRQKNITAIFEEIYNSFPNEKVVGIYTMTSPALLIRDIELAKQIVIKDFNCFHDRGIGISKEKLGESLFHCDIVTWRALKGKLSSYFCNGKLNSTVSTILECSDRFVEYIRKVSQDEPEQELHQLFRKYTMEATLGGLFSLKMDPYSDGNKEFLKKLDKSIFTKSYYSEMSMLFYNFMKLTNTSIFGKTAINFCKEIVKNAIKHRRDSKTNSFIDILLDLEETETNTGDKSGNKKNDLRITDHLIEAQVFIVFATSYESTSLCLSYAFNHLAKNIDVQNRLIEEIDSVMTKHNGLITNNSLEEMKYLKQVFNETLRLNPFSNTVQRVAMKNYTIPGTNIEVERGINVYISTLAIHHDKKYYKDPLKFDPERFNARNSNAFFPFGLGPRSCFGYKFSVLLFKVAMVKILSNFVVRPSENIRKEEIDPYRSLLTIKDGIHVNIFPRTKLL